MSDPVDNPAKSVCKCVLQKHQDGQPIMPIWIPGHEIVVVKLWKPLFDFSRLSDPMRFSAWIQDLLREKKKVGVGIHVLVDHGASFFPNIVPHILCTFWYSVSSSPTNVIFSCSCVLGTKVPVFRRHDRLVKG